MPARVKRYQLFLVAGDVALWYAALLVTLLIRYPGLPFDVLLAHLRPFTLLLILSLTAAYGAGLYDVRELKNGPVFTARCLAVVAASFACALAVFYFLPIGETAVTPKTNLFLFFLVLTVASSLWRTTFNGFLAVRTPVRLLLISDAPHVRELAAQLSSNPQLGYRVVAWHHSEATAGDVEPLATLARRKGIDAVVIPAALSRSLGVAHALYHALPRATATFDLATVYEETLGKIPLAELDEGRLLALLSHAPRSRDTLIRPLELILTLALIPLAAPLALIIAAAIKATSPGSAFFTQVRVGHHGEHFVLWKFRTMGEHAEAHGPRWATPGDARITPVGRFLRRTHLDELPQLANVLIGNLSLVGPRPERPEFVEELRAHIPFYDARHGVRPGITGWAQVHYRYGASVDEAYEKLQYDLYYLMHRSLLLNLAIIAKTVKRLFVPAK